MKRLIDGLIVLAMLRLLWSILDAVSYDGVRLVAFVAILLLAVAVVALESRR